MLTLHSFQRTLRDLTAAHQFCLAFSGGLDSAVLLHLFSSLRNAEPSLHLRAVHVNHGLSPHAQQWEETCKQVCHHYHIPLLVEQITLRHTANGSLEELARNGRYQVFRNLLAADEVLVTAHHQNDQAETLLLQLFRGAGPKGLAAMPASAPFAQGTLARPLLNFTRPMLEQYAQIAQLSWIEDESNSNINFDRNFLRQELLPLMARRWPAITRNLARAAKHCAQANCYIEQQMAAIFNTLFDQATGSLFIPSLLSQTLEVQNYLIRYWLQYLNLSLPSTQKLTLLHRDILRSRSDATPLLCWQQTQIRRYGNALYAMPPLPAHDPALVIEWDLTTDLLLPNDLGLIQLEALKKLGLEWQQEDKATIRFRQGGERCRLKNRQHSHSLKKLFQAWSVPPWLRDRTPLLYIGNELRAIIGFAVCDGIFSKRNYTLE